MFDYIHTFLAEAAGSDFFAGGLALGALGAAFGVLRLVASLLAGLAGRRWMASVTVDNRTGDYRHLLLYLENLGAMRHIRHVRGTGVRQNGSEVYAPQQGSYWIRVDGRPCRMTRGRVSKTRVGQSGKLLEEMTLMVPFARPDIVRDWIAKGAALAAAQVRRGPELFVLKGDWWDRVATLRPRGLNTVLADDDRVEHLASDMRRFFASEAWYGDRGVPWRRGYVLYGPPGTGKSSVIRALASDLERDIATIGLSAEKLSDDDLRDGMSCAPEGALIALEDIDAAFDGRTATREGSLLTFSGLLNAIDGVAAQEGRVLVMTTNHLARLDPALIRPGRADVHVELAEVGAVAAKSLFLRFFPGEEALADQFEANLGPARHTPAVLQGWLLSHAEDPITAATATGLQPANLSLAAE